MEEKNEIKMSDDTKKETEIVWEQLWKNKTVDEDEQRTKKGILFSKVKKYFKELEYKYNLDLWFEQTLKKELPKKDNQLILEAGCGEGETAARVCNEKDKLVLLDLSSSALQRTRERFKENSNLNFYVKGSIFELPFKKNIFDVVLSIGVLEHFNKEDFNTLYKEMIITTKNGGLIITMVPATSGLVYSICRYYAMKKNLWEYGYEISYKNLKPMISSINDVENIKEYTGAFLTQFYYLNFFLRRFKFFKMVILGLIALTNRIFWKINHIKKIGYFLINISKKIN